MKYECAGLHEEQNAALACMTTGVGEESKVIAATCEASLLHFLAPYTRHWGNPVMKFHDLKAKWEAETAFLSSINDICMHPAYQQIIGMGPIVVPIILSDMQKKIGHWFWALKSITGEDPVPSEEKGKMKLMTERWLQWGRDYGYI